MRTRPAVLGMAALVTLLAGALLLLALLTRTAQRVSDTPANPAGYARCDPVNAPELCPGGHY